MIIVESNRERETIDFFLKLLDTVATTLFVVIKVIDHNSDDVCKG